ncbi:murein biosynthesis integral membrane protein MurJ [Treponema sp. HNW]|uniref:murein biosynthesis integral membrane protein MurJ n=1 Tax=Treponema sp. HNW TaxID=3116654 RepID=UPI003D0F7C94
MKRSALSSGIKLSFLTFLSRILGLVREMTKAAFLGTSDLADAFGIAFMIPNLFRRLFAENSISVAFIPVFKSYLEERAAEKDKTGGTEKARDKELRLFLNSVFTLVSFFTALTTVLGIILIPYIAPLFIKDASQSIIPEMVFLTRLMFPYLAVISIAAFFQGILNSVKIFTPSGFTPVLFNIAVISAAYLLSPRTANPARAMAYGVIAGGTIQALFQLPFVLKEGFRPAFTGLKCAFGNPGTKRVLKLIGPTVIGMAAYQVNDVVSTALAGNAGSGIVSSLQYSLRLQELILGIFAVSVGTVILPDLAGLAKRKEYEAFEKMLSQAMHIIALITIPISFFLFVFGENLIILVYKTRRFSDESVFLTLKAFRFHIAGLFFIALNRIIAPAFYAQSDTKSPTIAGIGGFAVNILLALILIRPMKGGGIALALSLASFANTVILFVFLNKSKTIHTGRLVRPYIAYALKLALFSLLCVLPLYMFKQQLFAPFAHLHRFFAQGIPLFTAALVFAFLGIGLLALTKDASLMSIVRHVRKQSD